ncbi:MULTISPECIES: hypothetical protein [Rhodonellum]|uniref:Glycosyltransferase RgtA/B/C/D-like domain-containing protein n=1 Tax=Rhodonellum ikkaensis TaxID=336829 RepID=A0A1H3LHZ8_9BACT|nr:MULTISPECIES: hypothetical protein [Rhodonellum]SDY63799.1 hypothetical protein SAMN05444412_10264 [Rhodonellum ikkaensis]
MEKNIIQKPSTLFRHVSLPNGKSLVPLLFGFCVIVFFPTFFNDFQLAWDDTWQLLENPLVHDISFDYIFYHFTHFWHQQYSPVNSIFYSGIVLLFGMKATVFHSACLLIHVCNTMLVYGIVRKLVLRFLPSAPNSKINAFGFFTALIFAIHPLQVESVAWISASKILLYAFFTLTALWCYIRYIRTMHFPWLIAVGLAYAIGFGSKEQAIILPLNLMLFDYVFGRFKDLTWKNTLTSRVLLEKTPFLLLALAFWYFSWINNNVGINPDVGYPFYQRFIFGMHSFVEYIFRFLAPAKLYFFHPFPISPGESLPLYYWGYLVLVGIIGYFVWDNYRKGNQLVVFGFLFFLINLLLVLHIIPLPRPVISADRYMYLSMAGIALVLVWQLDQWLTSHTKAKVPLLAVCCTWFLFLGIQTYFRTADWKDSESTKSNVIELIDKKREAEATDPLFNLIEYE